MSVYTVKVTVRQNGAALPGTPFFRRFEDATSEAKLIDETFRTNDDQIPYGQASAVTPLVALRFSKPTIMQLNSNLGTKGFQMLENSAFLAMIGLSVTLTPTAGTRVQGAA